MRRPFRSPRPRLRLVLQSIVIVCALARLSFAIQDSLEKRYPATAAAGSIRACPVRIAAMVPVGSDDPRRIVARTFAVVLAGSRGEDRVSGSLWITASGRPFSVAFHGRNALANDLSGSIDPIVVALPRQSRLEEAFVDRYDDGGTARPCAIDGDWSGAMTAALHDDIAARIGTPPAAGALAAQPIRRPDTACENRNASARTLDDTPPTTPPEAARKKLSGDVQVLLDLDASSTVRAATVVSSPDSILNATSLDAARASLFRTAIRRCRPVAGKFVFVVSYLAYRQ